MTTPSFRKDALFNAVEHRQVTGRRVLKSLFLAIAAVATWVGPIRVGMALTPQPSEVCYDALGNTRYVNVGEPCKPNEQKTKILPQVPPNPADDPQAQLQTQVTDLLAKVSALQAQINQLQDKQKKTIRTRVNQSRLKM